MNLGRFFHKRNQHWGSGATITEYNSLLGQSSFDMLVPPTPQRLIDVSRWETNAWDMSYSPASWANGVNQSVWGMIAKITQGNLVDPSAWYWRDAKGVFVLGGYHFWQVKDGIPEANVFNVTRMAYGFTDIAPIIDFEPPKVYTAGIGDKLKVFFDAVEQGSGVPAILYSSKSFLDYHFPQGAPAWLTSKKLWIASWPAYDGTGDRWDLTNYSYKVPSLPKGWTYDRLIGWQFTDRLAIPGYAGNVDANFWYPDGFSV